MSYSGLGQPFYLKIALVCCSYLLPRAAWGSVSALLELLTGISTKDAGRAASSFTCCSCVSLVKIIAAVIIVTLMCGAIHCPGFPGAAGVQREPYISRCPTRFICLKTPRI